MWRPSSSGPNTSVVYDLPVIRSRARAAARNDPWAGSALDKLDANGIATGVVPKMVHGDDEQKRAIKTLFDAWAKVSDADGNLDFYGQQYLAWHEWNEVGEVFARLRPRRLEDGLPVPLQLQIIEAEQCPTDLFRQEASGNQIRAGIELNPLGRRVAYWFYREHPGERTLNVTADELVRVPADKVIHLYRPQRAGQLRGIPDSVSVLVRMFNLENMDDAVLERQKIANMFAGFYTKQIDPENPESIVDGMSTDADGDQELDDDDVPMAGLEPGTMQELPPGMTANFSQPPAPGQEYSEFLRGHLLALAARYGVPYEVLTGDLRGISDRALRLMLNEFRRSIEMKQWLFFIPIFLERIRETWFDFAYLGGSLPLADYLERRTEYIETLWVPKGWPYSHPVQDVTADIKAIQAGLDSRTAAILRTGDDPEAVDRAIAADNARADALGLAFTSDGRRESGAPAAPADKQDEDDEEDVEPRTPAGTKSLKSRVEAARSRRAVRRTRADLGQAAE
jgi:lambda family phage portal protein